MSSILHGNVGGVFASIPVFNQLVPNEGPRSIFMEMDFSVADKYIFDLQQEIAEKVIWGVQTFYYDNSQNNSDIVFEADVTGQRMTFQARWQGYRPVLLTSPPRGSFSTNTGSGIFRVLMLNVPMPFGEWVST